MAGVHPLDDEHQLVLPSTPPQSVSLTQGIHCLGNAGPVLEQYPGIYRTGPGYGDVTEVIVGTIVPETEVTGFDGKSVNFSITLY